MVEKPRDNKAQAHLLEVIGCIFIVVVGSLAIINAPITNHTPQEDLKMQESQEIKNLLHIMNNEGEFKQEFLDWNAANEPSSNNKFIQFEDLTNNNYFYNIYYSCDGSTYTYAEQGTPSVTNKVFKSHFLLYESDESGGTDLVNKNDFVCDNHHSSSHYYSMVEVEVVVWLV